MCVFTISGIFCGAEASGLNTHPVLPVGLFLSQKRGFHVAGCPGVLRAVMLGALLPSQVLRTPEL